MGRILRFYHKVAASEQLKECWRVGKVWFRKRLLVLAAQSAPAAASAHVLLESCGVLRGRVVGVRPAVLRTPGPGARQLGRRCRRGRVSGAHPARAPAALAEKPPRTAEPQGAEGPPPLSLPVL
jgi:hypothetical protein